MTISTILLRSLECVSSMNEGEYVVLYDREEFDPYIIHSGDENAENEFESVVSDSVDYSGYFENLQSIGLIFICFFIGSIMALSFAVGFKKS